MNEELLKIFFEEFKKNGIKLNDCEYRGDNFLADPLDVLNCPFFRDRKEMPLLDFSEHDRPFEDKIAKLEEELLRATKEIRQEKHKRELTEWERQELKQRIAELESEKSEKPTEINFNDQIKVKLTQLGVEIYYHQYDDLNESIKNNGGTPLEPRMPQIDKDGYTKFTLWHFMELYGQHIGMCKPNVVSPLYIELCPDEWKIRYDKEPIEKKDDLSE